MLTDILAKEAKNASEERALKIVDFAVGPKYSYVIIKGNERYSMGTAYMPVEDITPGMADNISIENLPNLVSSLNIQNKSLGIALINAISQYMLWIENNSYKIDFGNLIECVDRCCPHRNVVVIGNMVPLVKKLSGKRDIKVLERNPKLRFNAYPDSLAPRIIPYADTVIISGATLVNDTIDYILSLSSRAKYRVLVGPSAAIYPGWLKGKIDAVASMKINNIEETRKIIKKGGGRWDFAPYAQEYIILLD